MTTCTRCGRPDGPGARISPGRTTCNTCRRGTVPAAPPVARQPAAILAEQRQRLDAARVAAERDSMVGEVRRLERELAAVRELHTAPSPSSVIVPPPAKATQSEVVPLLIASDWHVEEHVDKAKMHGINEYTLEIAKQRSERYWQSASKLIAQAERASKVGRVAVGLLGDFISGSIHDELLETNQLGPAPAAAYAKGLLARGLRYLMDQHKGLSFDVYCVGGNHGRMTHKTRISTIAENSLETFMYEFLSADVSSDRMHVHVAPGDELYADLLPGYRVRFIHGDQIGYQGGVGGVTIPLNKWVMRQNESINADMTCLGHFHQSRADRTWLCNGSLIGASPYSKRFGFAPEPPRQQFALVHARHGRTMVADVWVT